MKSHNIAKGSAILGILIIAWIAYALIPWGSVAESEVFGIAVVDVVVLIHIFSFIKLL